MNKSILWDSDTKVYHYFYLEVIEIKRKCALYEKLQIVEMKCRGETWDKIAGCQGMPISEIKKVYRGIVRECLFFRLVYTCIDIDIWHEIRVVKQSDERYSTIKILANSIGTSWYEALVLVITSKCVRRKLGCKKKGLIVY